MSSRCGRTVQWNCGGGTSCAKMLINGPSISVTDLSWNLTLKLPIGLQFDTVTYIVDTLLQSVTWACTRPLYSYKIHSTPLLQLMFMQAFLLINNFNNRSTSSITNKRPEKQALGQISIA